MQNASLRHGTILFVLLGLILLAVAGFMLFAQENTAQSTFLARDGVPALPQASMPDGEINVNTAGKETLVLLPGVGEATAAEIIREREAHGPFRYPEDLLAVRGIGEKKLADMLPYIRLDEAR